MKPKWPVPPQRNQMRPNHVRPIPVHMASYKVPVLARPPKTQPAPFIFPSAVWKTPTAVYKPPNDNKPFLNSPPMTHSLPSNPPHPQHVVSQGYDFHINKEPIMNYPTIKQIGEKGPIHTIPAPNLSPADKPKLILEGQSHHKHAYQYTKDPELSLNSLNGISPGALLGAQALPLVSVGPSHSQQHQYQVTENAESGDHLVQQFPFTGQNNYYAPDSDNNLIQKLTHYTDSNALATNLKLYPQDMFVSPHQFVTNAASAPLSSQDLYQLLNGIPQQQVQQQQQHQQLVDSYGIPLMQQPQLQQHFVQQAAQNIPNTVNINYQSLFNSQPQFAQQQESAAYFNQIPDTVPQEIKDNFKPQFHTFNYEEQAAKTAKDFAQSRVTADYSIEPVAIESSPKIVQQQSPQEALAQTQYIQQYFATREDNNIVNDNDLGNQDNGNGFSQILSQLSAKNEIPSTIFYSTLPNKEAADTLATLQAAGSINNLLKLKQKQIEQAENQRDQMRIYVPDEEESYEDLDPQSSGETISSHNSKSKNVQSNIRIYETTHLKQQQQNADSRSGESLEYEDYSGEESANATVESQSNTHFGNKLQTKSNSAR